MTPSVGVSRTSRLTAAGALDVPLLADGLGDGVGLALPGALLLGAGSPVGPGDDAAPDGGSPTDGELPTSTTRADGAPCTGAAPPPDPGELLLDGDGARGPTVTVTTGPGAPAADGSTGTRSSETPPAEKPHTATAHR